MSDKSDKLCSLLLIPKGSNEGQIKKAFKKVALLYHPDKNSSEDAQALYSKITEAYTTWKYGLTDQETPDEEPPEPNAHRRPPPPPPQKAHRRPPPPPPPPQPQPKAHRRPGNYKTRLCKYPPGQCPFGYKCAYAHGPEELQVPDRCPKATKPVNGALKTKLCKHWLKKGYCERGDKCGFAHGTNQVQQRYCPKADAKGARYKTVLCKYPQGQCPFGDRCTFAHGPEELVSV